MMKGIPTKAKHSLKVRVLAFALLAGLLTSPGWAEEGISSRAKEIFEGHIKAIGGREAMESVQNVRINGTMSIPAAGMSMSLLVVQKSPNLFYTEQVIPDIGKNIAAYDGEIAWMQNPMMGFRFLEGEELAFQIEENHIHRELRYEERYISAKVIDRKSGRKMVVVEAVRAGNGEKDTLHYDKSTRLLKRIEMISDMGSRGRFPISLELGTYVDRGELKVPESFVMKNLAMKIIIKYQEIAYNTDISDISFSPLSQ